MVRANLDNVKKYTWDETIDALSLERRKIVDMVTPLADWQPVLDADNEFAMRHTPTGVDYKPTRWAMNQMAQKALCRQFDWLLEDPENTPKGYEWKRDVRDHELVRHFVETHMFQSDRIDMAKPRLVRTWAAQPGEKPTMRAFLSTQYQKVDNMWYVNELRRALPDASVIRWRGNADTLYFDMVHPELFKDTDDGGLGGMMHCGNSEIGQRRVILVPSVLRMICTNGMIVYVPKGESIRQIHKGGIDLVKLQVDITTRIQESVAKLGEGMDLLLGTRAYGVGDVPIKNVFVQMAIDNHFGKSGVNGIWKAWVAEGETMKREDVNSAYGLINAITRYGQTLAPETAYEYDTVAGKMAAGVNRDWTRFLERARHLSDTAMDKYMVAA